jgi:hypothetical protein
MWWGGFLLCGLLLIIVAIPFFSFPKVKKMLFLVSTRLFCIEVDFYLDPLDARDRFITQNSLQVLTREKKKIRSAEQYRQQIPPSHNSSNSLPRQSQTSTQKPQQNSSANVGERLWQRHQR